MKKALLLFFVLFQMVASAQQMEQAFLESFATKGSQEFFYKNSRSSYGSYTYIAGASLNNAGNYDMLLVKYSGTTELWTVTWNGAANGNDYASDVIVDSSGNIIIVGTSYIGNTVNYDGVIVKYNSSGTLQWSSSYAGGANLADGFVSIEKDNSNNLYVCGGTTGTSDLTNFLTVKYNSSGTQQWASIYDYNDLHDVAVKLVLTNSTVFTSGGSQNSGTDWKMSSVAYNISTGTQTAAQQTGGDDEGIDAVTDAWTDGTYTYVVGAVKNSTGFDWKVLKLDANLTVAWSASYNGGDNLDDIANSVKVDGSGNVFVTGYFTSNAEGKNFLTRKYSSAGTLLWSSTYHEQLDDEASTLELDASGNVLVAGSSYKDGNLDFLTLKYKTTDGSEIWKTRFNSDFNDDDIPSNIGLDESGNVLVVGTIAKGEGLTTYMLCKYSEKTIYVPHPSEGFLASNGYIHNRKQLRNTNGSANTSVKFYNQEHRTSTFINDGQIYYELHQAADSANVDTNFVVKMQFTKSISGVKVYPIQEKDKVLNYYLGHMGSKAERTPEYNSIVKPGAYTNTDLFYTHSKTGFRHWIVARSGAPTADFEMTFSGQSALSLDGSGNLKIETSLGDILVSKTKAYSLNNTTGAMTLLGWQPSFVISGGNKVSFSGFGTWSGTLVLEYGEVGSTLEAISFVNNLEWSTFFGGNNAERNWDVKNSAEGKVWYCGETTGNVFDPNLGLNVGVQHAQQDAFVVHFNGECIPQWFTFYGGSDIDIAYGLDIDENENCHVVGFTQSDDIYNSSNEGLNYINLNGSSDGFYIKINSANGHIDVDSYIGGNGNDAALGVACRPNFGGLPAGVFIGGFSSNGTNFPLQASPSIFGYDQTHAGIGNNNDGFVMRLDSLSNLKWSTFFGGDGNDYIHSIACVAGNPVIAGMTTTDFYTEDLCTTPSDGGFPSCVAEGGWQQSEFLGNEGNFFVARFDKSDSLKYSTYFGACPTLIQPTERPEIAAYYTGFIPNGKYDFYVSGKSSGFYATDFPYDEWPLNFVNAYYQLATTSYDFDWLARFFVDGGFTTLEGSTAIQWEGVPLNINVSVDEDKGVAISGSGIIEQLQSGNEYCQMPSNGDFPLCNPNSDQWLEDNLTSGSPRCFVMHFDSLMKMDWSTQFGNAPTNYSDCVSSEGEFIFLGGYSTSNYTLLEFDEGSDADYFDAAIVNFDQDATITRFKLPQYVNVENLDGVEQKFDLQLYPNPSNGQINVVLPKPFENGDRLEIFDITGKLTNTIPVRNATTIVSFNAEELSQGMYSIRYVSNMSSACSLFFKR